MVSEKHDTVAEIRRLALAAMAERGIEGMTVQQIAHEAGCAKSNVLYHFGSKQGLVEAALTPAVEALGRLIEDLERVVADGGSIADPEPAERFVDTLIEHRLAANLVLNRMGELPDGVQVLHAGTRLDDEGLLVSAGGRVLSVVALGADLADARARAYEGVAAVDLPGSHHRTDIALAAERGELSC